MKTTWVKFDAGSGFIEAGGMPAIRTTLELPGLRLVVPQASLLLQAMICLLCAAVSTLADTHYVDINSTNSVPPYLSWQTASTDIQPALDTAGNGDTVLVANGTYSITSQIMINKGLTLKSMNGPASTIITANRKCRVLNITTQCGPISLEGFTITGGYAGGRDSNGGGILASGSVPPLISNCIVENNEAAQGAGGICLSVKSSSSSVITNCIVRNNRARVHGGGITAGSAIIKNCIINDNLCGDAGGGIMAGRGALVSRCRIFDNAAGRGGGVYLGPSATLCESLVYRNETHKFIGGGVQSKVDDDAGLILNCTIVDNCAHTRGGGVSGGQIYNSIVYANRAGGDYDDTGEFSVVGNSCVGSKLSYDAGNITDSPIFENAKKGDFRLRLDSPCIDAGSNTHIHSVTDLHGNPRIMDGNRDGESVVDMGAYEYVVIPVEIDIRPDSNSNVINPNERGLLPVAILATESFDIASIDPASIRFAGATPERRQLEDVDKDGDADLLLQFQRQRLLLGNKSTRALLIGQTKEDEPFIGQAPVEIVTAQ